MLLQKKTAMVAVELLLCVSGIYGAYLTQGVVQETLAIRRFGPDQVRFTHLSSLNAVQSWVCFIWAFALLSLSTLGSKSGRENPSPPITVYWKAGITNSLGPACGLAALTYISYPAQVLAKSSKMIPIMVVGVLLYGRRYAPIEYFCCALVSGGVSLFALRSSGKVTSKLAAPNAPLGYALCAANLLLDGYTNAAQDEINRKYKGAGSPLSMMCWMNFWCGLYYIPLMFVASSVGIDVVEFCLVHREAAWDILLFCLCGAIGQLFIFYTIRRFGSLVNTLITTTRKFFNILMSVVWNGNPLLPQQWIAVGMVFLGLLLHTAAKNLLHKRVKVQ